MVERRNSKIRYNKLFLIIIFTCVNFLNAGTFNENLQVLKFQSDKEEIKKKILNQLKCDKKLIATIIEEISDRSNDNFYRCDLLEIASESNYKQLEEYLAELLKEDNPELNSCIARTAVKFKNTYVIDQLVLKVENYLNDNPKGVFEQDLKKKIATIDAIWALGEVGDPKVINKLQEFYNLSDEVLRVNLIFSMGKLKTKKVLPYLKRIAENETETDIVRSAAYEIIEEIEQGESE